jgi:hypothetical protein
MNISPEEEIRRLREENRRLRSVQFAAHNIAESLSETYEGWTFYEPYLDDLRAALKAVKDDC